MRSVPVLVAVALGAMVLASGCGKQHGGIPAGPPLSTSASAALEQSPVPGDPHSASCGSAAPPISLINITYADKGRTLCIRPGTAVQVYLKGATTARWSPIRTSNKAVLAPHANGRLMVMAGVTGASFLAIHRGTATISSLGRPCGPDTTPGNAAAPGGVMECGVIVAFHVTVKVT